MLCASLQQRSLGERGTCQEHVRRRAVRAGHGACAVRCAQQPGGAQLKLDSSKTVQAGAKGETSRRQLLALAFAGTVAAGSPAYADVMATPDEQFTITPPKEWVQGESELPGTMGARRLLGWHPADNTTTAVSIVTSNANADIVSLGAMGSAYEFAFTLVVGQDRRARKTDPQIAELIDYKSQGGSYFVEYTIQRPEEGIFRHVYEQVTLKFDGRYNKLWTVTGSYLDGDKEKSEAAVKDMVNSFKLTY